MTLVELQRALARLVRTGEHEGIAADAYLSEVETSEGLEAIREIAMSWNEFTIERLCPLTARLLRQRLEFGHALAQLAAANLPSPFVEDLAELFLAQRMAGGPAIVSDVARFEAAMLRVCRGATASETVEWHHDPDAVIEALMAGREASDALLLDRTCRTVVSLDLPSLYRVGR